jgi:DNA-binding HxlR family transcriptional regulator
MLPVVTCNLQVTGPSGYTAAMALASRRSPCPVACTLDVLGDKWTLLVVRDIMRGKSRYAEFLASPEGIPTNILAERLKRLAAKGIIRGRRYSEHPPRVEYSLTAKGEDLRPVMRSMAEWGVRHAGGKMPPPPAPPREGPRHS